MFHSNLSSVVDRWAILRLAVISSGSYVVWLIIFERWLEPFLRRCGGAIPGRSIVWVRASGPFRIWGLRDHARAALDVMVGFLGSVAVLGSAVLPAAALRVAVVIQMGDARTAASNYLMSLAMMTVFVLHVLSGRPETR